MSVKNLMRVLAGTAGVLLVAGAAGPGAAAVTTEDSGDVQATVRKTVRQAATATGEITNSTMYTQISAVGNGTKTVTVPVGTTSNRNLNSFGPFPMEGESMVVDLTVADGGGTEQRTVTDADIAPMAVSVKVMLDGAEIAPEDVVGASGVLDVEYTVRNTTAKTGPVTYTDVEGKEITEDLETADPFVGSLDVVLPRGFNEVTAPGATVAGNGQNETLLGYTFVLFPPLGSPEVKVSYQSRISDGQMPAAEFSFLPIVPFTNSTIAGTTESYKGAVASSATIFGAGEQIGDNLLKLQEGAGKLVAGLGQLSAGASQLSEGLAPAAPGSAKLADGANQVSDGLSQLNDNVPALEEGVSDLNAGAQQLNSGANQVADGNAELAAGIAKLNGGINLLSQGVAALPSHVQSTSGYKQLQDALTGVQKAIGSANDAFVPAPKTLNGAINALEFGLDNPCDEADPENPADPCGFKQVLEILDGQLDNSDPVDPGAKQALTSILGVLGTTAPTPPDGPLPLGGFVTATQQLFGALGCAPLTPTTGSCSGVADPYKGLAYSTLGFYLKALGSTDTPGNTVLFGLNSILEKIGSPTTSGTALYAINGLIEGIGTKGDFPKTTGTLYYGLEGIRVGLTNPNCKTTDPTNAANPCGIKEIQGLVAAGINQLVAGISQELLKGLGTSPAAKGCDPTTTLTCASAAATAGSAALASGAAQLADGTDTLAAGTKKLNSSVPTLATGVSKLDDGAAQVADGADQLAAGLGAAADGSAQLADGLAQAEPGGAQIEDGAGQLKEQGADELAKSAKESQLGYAKNVALLEAAQQAGLEGAGIPFGTAEGTDVTTTAAYKMFVAGIAADTENNALKFGLGALLIAGAGGVAFAAARKFAA
jgi:putative membrane protein